MAKSDYGLSANSHATVETIGREERELRLAFAFGEISRRTFNCRYKKLEREGKIFRKY